MDIVEHESGEQLFIPRAWTRWSYDGQEYRRGATERVQVMRSGVWGDLTRDVRAAEASARARQAVRGPLLRPVGPA